MSQLFDVELPLSGAGGPTLSGGARFLSAGGGLPNRITTQADVLIDNVMTTNYGGVIIDPTETFAWISNWGSGAGTITQYALASGTPGTSLAYPTMGLFPFDNSLFYAADYTDNLIQELQWDGTLVSSTSFSQVSVVARVPGTTGKVWGITYPGGAATEVAIGGAPTARTIAGVFFGIWATTGFIYLSDMVNIYKYDEPTLTLQDTWAVRQNSSSRPGDSGLAQYVNWFFIDSNNKPVLYEGLHGNIDRFASVGGTPAPVDKRLVYSQPQLGGSGSFFYPGDNNIVSPPIHYLANGKYAAFAVPWNNDASDYSHISVLFKNLFGTQRARWTWNNATGQTATITRIVVPGNLADDRGSTYDLRKAHCFYSTDGGATRTPFMPGGTLSVPVINGSALTVDVDIVEGDGQATNPPYIGGDAGEGVHLVFSIPTGGAGIPVTNFTPAPGTPLSPQQVVQFDVTDTTSPFREVFIVASFDGGTQRELVYDADGFNPAHYAGVSNTKTTITNGFRFTLLRDGGWFGALSIKVYAIDEGGGENP